MQATTLYEALQGMERTAQSLQVQGVAVVMACHNANVTTGKSDLLPHFRVVGRFERPPEPETRGLTDTGTNYLAIAWSKVAEMVSTQADSGSAYRAERNGECGYQGGLVRQRGEWTYFVAFSGGSESQDLQIAQVGMDVLLKS